MINSGIGSATLWYKWVRYSTTRPRAADGSILGVDPKQSKGGSLRVYRALIDKLNHVQTKGLVLLGYVARVQWTLMTVDDRIPQLTHSALADAQQESKTALAHSVPAQCQNILFHFLLGL